MTDPNVNATAQSVSDKLDGTDGNGNQLGNRKVAMLYEADILGLLKDYAFTEGSNESASLLDQIVTLAKIFTRKHTFVEGGDQLDAWDMLCAITKWVYKQDPTILDDEPNSVNYKPPAAS